MPPDEIDSKVMSTDKNSTSISSPTAMQEPTTESGQESRDQNDADPLEESQMEEDANEAQENVQSSVVTDPDEQYQPAESRKEASINGTSVENAEQDEDLLSRRASLRGSSKLSEEVRRLREHAKLLGKIPLSSKRAKRRKKKGAGSRDKAMSKSTLTRQSTTTVGYGNLQEWPSISSSIRQHFPTLANPLQLPSAVQKLIMNKLNPNTGQHQNPRQNLESLIQQQHQNQLPQGMDESALNEIMHQHQKDNGRLVDFLNQWAPSEDTPTLAGMNSASLDKHQPSNNMVPVEIIGLDPAVTNSILYDSNGSVDSQADSSQTYPSKGDNSANSIYPQSDMHQVNQYGASNLQSKGYPGRTSSVLHIHHFHHSQVRPGNAMMQGQAGTGMKTDDQGESSANGNNVQSIESLSGNYVQTRQQQEKVIQSPMYVNEKGEVVYLAMAAPTSQDDQSGGAENRPMNGESEQTEQQQLNSGSPGTNQEIQLIDPNNPQNHISQHQMNQEYPGLDSTRAQGDPMQSTIIGDSSGTEEHPMDPSSMQEQTTSRPQQVANESPSSHSVYAMTKNRQLYGTKHPRAFAETSDSQTVHSESSQIGPETNSGDAKQPQKQLLMVSYKPQQQPQRNITEDSRTPKGTRNPYNEGQESKSSLITAKHPVVGHHDMLKGTTLLLGPIMGNSMDQRLVRPGLPLDPNRQISIAELANRLNRNKAIYSSDPALQTGLNGFKGPNQFVAHANRAFLDNQVPSNVSLHSSLLPGLKLTSELGLMTDNLGYGNRTSQFGNPWMDAKLLQANGYDNMRRIPALMQNRNDTFQQQLNLMDSFGLMKHLQQINNQRRLNPGNFNNQPQQQQLPNPNNHLNSAELLSLLQEQQHLKTDLQRNNITNQLLNTMSANISQANLDPQLVTATSRPARFELTQASDQSMAKQVAKLATYNNTPSQSVFHHQYYHNKLAGDQLNAANLNSPIEAQKFPDKETLFNLHKSQVKHAKPMSTVGLNEAEMGDYNDSSGLGNFAVAFMVVVSLITMIIVGFTVFYRYRRRSIRRCAELPTRSRLNFTKRTKQFVRSNFVSPNDVTSIKSLNSDNHLATVGCSGDNGRPANGSPANGTLRKNDNVYCRNNEPAGPEDLGADCRASGNYTSKKTLGQSLATFNGASSSSSSQFSTSQEESFGTDIKTLQTKLQKPSYLKTLVYSPECLLTNKKQQPQRTGKLPEPSSSYLNMRNRIGQLSSQQRGSPGGDSNLSIKKLNPVAPKLHNNPKYADDFKHQSDKMSTIRSVGNTAEIKAAIEAGISQDNKKPQRVDMFGGKLPSPKHLVAVPNSIGLDRSKSPDSSQIDRL